MLRFVARSLAINLAGIYIVTRLLSNVFTIEGGAVKFILAAAAISIANLLIRPLINLFLLPLNLVTLGLFRWVANVGVLFAATRLVPQMQIHAFTSGRVELPFLIIPAITFSPFSAFIVVTLILSLVFHLLYWLFQE